MLAEKKIEKREQKQNRAEAHQRLSPRMRFRANARLNSGGGEFVLQIAGEIQINDGAEHHIHVLRAASALTDVFAAQFLRGFAFLDEQGERHIFVVHDLLILEQFEEAVVGDIFNLLVAALPKNHRQRDQSETERQHDNAAPIEVRLVAALFVLALGVAVRLWHKGCAYSRDQRLS